MAKLNKKEADKKYFDKYKNTNRREENKKIKQERERKHLDKLKKRAEVRRLNKKINKNTKKLNNNTEVQMLDPFITKQEMFDKIYQDVMSGKYKIENEWLSPYKRAKKVYKQKKILGTLMPDYCRDNRDYGWWKSMFDKLKDETKNEARILKLNVGKITIEGRKEMKMYE